MSRGDIRAAKPALEHYDRIAGRLKGKELALFLDYDGTLTPIVRRPEEAILGQEMRLLLSQLAQHSTLAIVSGRDRRDAEAMVGLENLVYAGSHGFDIRGPGGLHMQHPEAKSALPDLDEAEKSLRQRIDLITGAHVERKKFAIAVHYRQVGSRGKIRRVEKAVDEVVAQFPGLRKQGGKKIFELQPDVEWGKGLAVQWLLQALGLDHSGVAVIYIGDDITDEDAFRVLRSRENGIGIRVGVAASDTFASYALRDCNEVSHFLASLLLVLEEESM